MGHFFAVTAVKTEDVNQVFNVIIETGMKFGCKIEHGDLNDYDDSCDCYIYKNCSEWVLITWPNYFNIHDQYFANTLSTKLNTLVSTISVYEGSLWTHVLYESGEEVHRFCNMPDYFDEENILSSDNGKKGIKILAEKFRVDCGKVKGYFTYLPDDEDDLKFEKVHDSDEFEIWDFWVFCDFWKKVGIGYPDNQDNVIGKLVFPKEFDKKLPINEE
jgi:hypothetical protein